MGMTARLFIILGLGLALPAVTPAAAQFSDSYNFLKAVREADGNKVQGLIDKPGMIDTKDASTGETALHIVVRRHDETYLAFLLGRGANANARDRRGETPLLVAARLSDPEAARLLLSGGAGIDAANNAGETPLIIAVQQRSIPTVRLLVANGADAKLPDHVAGKNAHDYAVDDPRAAPILKILDQARPATLPKGISGPVRPH